MDARHLVGKRYRTRNRRDADPNGNRALTQVGEDRPKPRARIQVAWKIAARLGPQVLQFDWLEAGVKIAGAPSTRGFGTELVERLIARELKGGREDDFPGWWCALHDRDSIERS